MLEIIRILSKNGISLYNIERQAGLSGGLLHHIRKTGRWSPRTERKVNEYYQRLAKELISLL